MKKWYALAGIFLAACGSTATADEPGASNPLCNAGATRTCACEAGTSGTQSCAENGGGWSVCQCKSTFLDASFDQKTDAAGVCGDGFCDEVDGETCQTCPLDCKECAKCDFSPSCSDTNAVIPPVTSMALPEFNNNYSDNFASGLPMSTPLDKTNCQGARLQLRIKEIKIVDTGNYGAGGLGGSNPINVMCSVLTQEGVSQGQAVQFIATPMLSKVDKGQTKQFPPLLATFWGQDPSAMSNPDAGTPAVSLPRLTQKGLQISYQCYAADEPDAFAQALGTVAGLAGGAGAIPGNPYGWAFSLGSVAAGALQGALGQASGVTLRLNVNQQIDENALLELTNGREWHIQQKGNVDHTFDDHDWNFDLTVQSWGCSLKDPSQAH